MSHATRSASLMGWPKRGLSGSGCTACGPELPSGMPLDDLAAVPPPMLAQPQTAAAAAVDAASSLSLADDIAHLPFRVDRPGLNGVVVLDEAHDRAHLLDVLHAGLYVARAVDGTAHQHRGTAVPVPADLEPRQALVHDRLFEHCLAPVLAPVDRYVDRADLAHARPGEPGDLVETRAPELLAARRRRNDGLAFHHHAELPPLAFGHRIGVPRASPAELPRPPPILSPPHPLHAVL